MSVVMKSTLLNRNTKLTRPEVSEADPQRNKSKKKVTEKCLIFLVSNINPEISSSTAIYKI